MIDGHRVRSLIWTAAVAFAVESDMRTLEAVSTLPSVATGAGAQTMSPQG